MKRIVFQVMVLLVLCLKNDFYPVFFCIFEKCTVLFCLCTCFKFASNCALCLFSNSVVFKKLNFIPLANLLSLMELFFSADESRVVDMSLHTDSLSLCHQRTVPVHLL